MLNIKTTMTAESRRLSPMPAAVAAIVATALAVVASAVFASFASAQAPITLRDVLRAVNDSAEVRLARQAQAGAEADVLSADHAPLPVLSSKLSQIDLQNGLGAGDWLGRKRIDKAIGIDWTYERGDKRLHRTSAAKSLVAATAAEIQETQLQQMLAGQAAYFDWLAARERVQLATMMELASRESVSAAQTRLKAGDLSQQDASRIEIDAARVGVDKSTAQLDLARAVVTLAQVTRRSDVAAASVGPVEWPTVTDYSQPAAVVDEAATSLIAMRGDVRASRERVSAATSALESAYALQKVDPTWGISFDHYPGTSTRLIELRVQIPLTWGYRYQGEAARAQSDLKQAELTVERVMRDARTELARLHEEAVAMERRTESFDKDIVPRASQVASQAEFAYKRGALSLTDLLDARRTLRTTQLDALAARADLAKARTALMLRTDPQRVLR